MIREGAGWNGNLVSRKLGIVNEMKDLIVIKLKKEWKKQVDYGCDIDYVLTSAPLTQAAVRRMIKESVDAAITTERARQANVRN
ncbi:hypothetical protein Tco_0989475 [Tanacetum coccineum]|uniref:Uncharacterized protein n=1 Tax=Tanacetum coccineum TaxID=301880 RepID=A0ABQ5ETQ8_9ASTR